MYAFMRMGPKIFTIDANFEFRNQRYFRKEALTLPDPLTGKLSNPDDESMIRELKEAAMSSTSFNCWNTFVKTSTENAATFCCSNVFMCCQCFGIMALMDARTVAPGKSKVTRMRPTSVPQASQ